ncbi:MAG TPA: Mth938-like domain-containing protein [Stellaceae bacterium]|jgi:uncharacterized protein
MELTPLVPPGRQLIERYGPSGFRVSGIIWPGAVLVFPDETVAWTAVTIADITRESLDPILGRDVQVLLLGLGRRMAPVDISLRNTLRDAGIALEPMDTGAACRTYNILVAEERRVAAALLPSI